MKTEKKNIWCRIFGHTWKEILGIGIYGYIIKGKKCNRCGETIKYKPKTV